MVSTRTSSGRVAGWIPAILFNSLLLLMPYFAVQVIAGAYSESPQKDHPNAEIVAETRRAIDDAFSDIAAKGGDARLHWAQLVAKELDARNVSAARGFLLAAPQLLSREDARAIRAAANEEPSGSADQRLLRAALLFLPNDVRNGYLESARPRGTELISTDTLPADDTLADVEEVVPARLPEADLAAADDPFQQMTRTPEFYVLGTLEDLANNSRDWVMGDRKHTVELKLAGLAMAADPSTIGVSSTRLMKAASVLKTALRTDHLDPQYARTLSQRIDVAIPDDVLAAELDEALAEVAPMRVRSERVRDAFAASIDPRAVQRLSPELDQIGRIAHSTSARGALSLLEHTRSATDVRKARLVAEAGGDRAVALASVFGGKVLSFTGTNLQWSQTTILMIMALVAAAIALVLTTVSALLRMRFGRPAQAVL